MQIIKKSFDVTISCCGDLGPVLYYSVLVFLHAKEYGHGDCEYVITCHRRLFKIVKYFVCKFMILKIHNFTSLSLFYVVNY